MAAKSTSSTVLVTASEVASFMVRCLTAAGANESHARQQADLLVAADLRGHFSHGLNRLEHYVKDLKNGLMASGGGVEDHLPSVVRQTAATALVDGKNLFGAVVGNFCMDLAIEKARNAGIGWVVARGSNHYGMSGYYTRRAIEQGMLGLSVTNTSPLMPPTRSKEACLGTNPLSVGAPAKDGDSFVLDMATTAVALGKLEIQHRKHEPIPSGWALDRNGQVTTDSTEALQTELLLPLGGEEQNSGYKGYGLAMMVEVFSGLLAGSSFGHNIRRWTDVDRVADLGQCFMALDPSVFAPGFEGRMSDLMDHCRNLEPIDPLKPVLVPGDPERHHFDDCVARGGILYPANVIKAYDVVAAQLNIDPIERN